MKAAVEMSSLRFVLGIRSWIPSSFSGSSQAERRPQSWQGFHVWKLEVLPMKGVAVTSRALDQFVSLPKCQQNRQQRPEWKAP